MLWASEAKPGSAVRGTFPNLSPTCKMGIKILLQVLARVLNKTTPSMAPNEDIPFTGEKCLITGTSKETFSHSLLLPRPPHPPLHEKPKLRSEQPLSGVRCARER